MTDESRSRVLRGPNRPGWWRAWFLLYAPPISLALVTSVFAILAVRAAGGDRSVIGPAVQDNITLIIAVNHTLVFITVLAFLAADRLSLADIGWRMARPAAWSAMKECLIGLAAGAVIYVIHQYGLTPGIAALFAETELSTFRAVSGSAPLGGDALSAILAGVVLGGIVEETVYRGYVLTRLTERLPVWLALIPLTIGFALLHFGLGLSGMAVAGSTGLLLSFLFVWRRNLLSPVIAHALVNTLVLAL